MSKGYIVGLQSFHEQLKDGSHLVTIEISGLPSLENAQQISNWARDLFRSHAHELGWLEPPPPVQ